MVLGKGNQMKDRERGTGLDYIAHKTCTQFVANTSNYQYEKENITA